MNNKNISIEFKSLSNQEWSNIIKEFSDANIYQTYAYGIIRWGKNSIKHLIVRNNDYILSVAQIVNIKIPLINLEMAYVFRGPLWRNKGQPIDHSSFKIALQALNQEYVINNKKCLIISSNEFDNSDFERIFSNHGFKVIKHSQAYRTLLLDLNQPLDDLRKNLNKKWRAHLRKAEKNDLNIFQGTNSELFETFSFLHKEMHKRKRFAEFVDLNEYLKIQECLDEQSKMQIMICEYKNRPISGLVWSGIGNTGIPIFSATGNQGLKLNSSYLLRWKLLEDLKKKGFRFLDQGGINPDTNRGGYSFKKGMGGEDVQLLNQYIKCPNRLFNVFFRTVIFLNTKRKLLKRFYYIKKARQKI